MASRIRPGGAAALLAVALLGLSFRARAGSNQMRSDVLDCEDALARLAKCCPDFEVNVVTCDYNFSEGCGSTSTTLPALTRQESDCIRDTTCERLVASKVCERAQKARSTTTYYDPDHTPPTTTWTPPPSAIGSATTSASSPVHPVCP